MLKINNDSLEININMKMARYFDADIVLNIIYRHSIAYTACGYTHTNNLDRSFRSKRINSL